MASPEEACFSDGQYTNLPSLCEKRRSTHFREKRRCPSSGRRYQSESTTFRRVPLSHSLQVLRGEGAYTSIGNQQPFAYSSRRGPFDVPGYSSLQLPDTIEPLCSGKTTHYDGCCLVSRETIPKGGKHCDLSTLRHSNKKHFS